MLRPSLPLPAAHRAWPARPQPCQAPVLAARLLATVASARGAGAGRSAPATAPRAVRAKKAAPATQAAVPRRAARAAQDAAAEPAGLKARRKEPREEKEKEKEAQDEDAGVLDLPPEQVGDIGALQKEAAAEVRRLRRDIAETQRTRRMLEGMLEEIEAATEARRRVKRAASRGRPLPPTASPGAGPGTAPAPGPAPATGVGARQASEQGLALAPTAGTQAAAPAPGTASAKAQRYAINHQKPYQVSVEEVLALLEEERAEDVVTLDVRRKCNWTSYFVIASARSARQIEGMAQSILQKLKEKRRKFLHEVDDSSPEWVAIDMGELVLHLMMPAVRRKYDLEGLWNRRPELSQEELQRSMLQPDPEDTPDNYLPDDGVDESLHPSEAGLTEDDMKQIESMDDEGALRALTRGHPAEPVPPSLRAQKDRPGQGSAGKKAGQGKRVPARRGR